MHSCKPSDIKHEWPIGSVIHYGLAVHSCWEDADGRLWVEGGMGEEYGNQVNFCPFCGFAARVTIVPPAMQEEAP